MKTTARHTLLKMLFTTALFATGAVANAQTAGAAPAATATGETVLQAGDNRVAIPDSPGSYLLLHASSTAIDRVQLLAGGASRPTPMDQTRPIGAACFEPFKQACYIENKSGPKKTICFCEGNGPARIKGMPMTIVNNTGDNVR